MKKLFVPILLLFMVGCAPIVYTNDSPDANWARDSAACEAYSLGNAPMPTMQSATPYDISGSGVVLGPGGYSSYNYSGTVYPDQLQNSVNNLNAGLAAYGRRQHLYEMCLKSLGWYEADGSNQGESIERENYDKYVLCVEEEAWRVAQNYQDAQVLANDLEKICHERTKGFVKRFALSQATLAIEQKSKHTPNK